MAWQRPFVSADCWRKLLRSTEILHPVSCRLPSSPSLPWGRINRAGLLWGHLGAQRSCRPAAQLVAGRECSLRHAWSPAAAVAAPAPPRRLGHGVAVGGGEGNPPDCQDLRGSATIHAAQLGPSLASTLGTRWQCSLCLCQWLFQPVCIWKASVLQRESLQLGELGCPVKRIPSSPQSFACIVVQALSWQCLRSP